MDEMMNFSKLCVNELKHSTVQYTRYDSMYCNFSIHCQEDSTVAGVTRHPCHLTLKQKEIHIQQYQLATLLYRKLGLLFTIKI